MARYAIGDIQGCYSALMSLLATINFNPGSDTLYLTGDLVNRGSESLKTLEWIYQHQDSVVSILGNHDIYLLARFTGVLAADDDETITDILNYKNAKILIDYLRHCPIMIELDKYFLVHAGIYPRLNISKVLDLSANIGFELLKSDYPKFLENIYGNKPAAWSDDLDYLQQLKFMINSATRMRFLNQTDFSLNYKYKGELANSPDGTIPWFKVEFDPSINKKIIFGHWAALGFYHNNHVISIDTGCVWGRYLSAINLDTLELTQIKNTYL